VTGFFVSYVTISLISATIGYSVPSSIIASNTSSDF